MLYNNYSKKIRYRQINEKEKSMQLEQNWDKVFPKSNKVNHEKVIFHNRYGIELVGDFYTPLESKKNRLLLLLVDHLGQ